MSRTSRAKRDRDRELAQARRRSGLTQQQMDAQYRAALERNPQANPYARRHGTRTKT